MSGVGKIGSGASKGPVGALEVSKGLVRALKALESPGLFDPKRFSWFLLLDQSVWALKARPLYISCPCPQTKVISSNELADLLGMEILELLKGVVRITNNWH